LLRDHGKSEVMIDEQNERLSLLRRQLQARSDTLGEKCARFRMWPRPDGFTAIV
jgi:hypothetical protein